MSNSDRQPFAWRLRADGRYMVMSAADDAVELIDRARAAIEAAVTVRAAARRIKSQTRQTRAITGFIRMRADRTGRVH